MLKKWKKNQEMSFFHFQATYVPAYCPSQFLWAVCLAVCLMIYVCFLIYRFDEDSKIFDWFLSDFGLISGFFSESRCFLKISKDFWWISRFHKNLENFRKKSCIFFVETWFLDLGFEDFRLDAKSLLRFHLTTWTSWCYDGCLLIVKWRLWMTSLDHIIWVGTKCVMWVQLKYLCSKFILFNRPQFFITFYS